jgi:hypothetical protein
MKKANQKVKVLYNIQMEILLKVNSLMVKKMEWDLGKIKMVVFIKENIKKTCRMEKVNTLGQKMIFMMDIGDLEYSIQATVNMMD